MRGSRGALSKLLTGVVLLAGCGADGAMTELPDAAGGDATVDGSLEVPLEPGFFTHVAVICE